MLLAFLTKIIENHEIFNLSVASPFPVTKYQVWIQRRDLSQTPKSKKWKIAGHWQSVEFLN
jgi:hypothetical protein